MSEKSGVSWTAASWGPWRGCQKIAAGCQNCYAERDMKRYGMDHSTVVKARPATFNAPLKWEPTEVFVCPWSDFWLPEADDWREETFAIMRRTAHAFLIPTKRPELMLARLPADWSDLNVWPGISVATQEDVERLLPEVHLNPGRWWISAEPLLGPLDLSRWLPQVVGHDRWWSKTTIYGVRLQGVVIGAESGTNARPCQMAWIKDLVEQCDAAQLPVYVKQAHVDGRLVKMPAVLGAVRDALPWRA